MKKTNALPRGYRLQQYHIEGILGAGGFGITYRAVHEALRTRAAIKEYFPVEWCYRDKDDVTVLSNAQGQEPADSSEEDCYTWGLTRFLKEARTLAKVNHPGVVRVRDYFTFNGTAYIVMDYEEGEPLSLVLHRDKTLAEEKIRDLLGDLLPALSAVHGHGFLHRDLKPGNIYIRRNGRAMLLDFGAARQALGSRSRNVTSVFTPGYSPIEQYFTDAKDYGPWTDIYALGAVIYHCITGSSPPEAAGRVLTDPMQPAVKVAKGNYTKALLRVVDRALAVRPEARYATVEDMQKALRRGVDGSFWHWSSWLPWLGGGVALLALLAVGKMAVEIAINNNSTTIPPFMEHTEALTGIVLVWIPGGCFQMGTVTPVPGEESTNERPHEICVKGFWIGKHEVTNDQYQRFRVSHDSGSYDTYSLHGTNQPVVNINWQEAVDYTRWLTWQTGERFRLPTEAEWEYATRAGTATSRFWGDEPNQACEYANVYDQSARRVHEFNWDHHRCYDGQVVTAPVGSYKANAFLLHDMLGNVWEWTCSSYSPDYTGSEETCSDADNTESRRVLRGGSWDTYPAQVRSAHRFSVAPGYRNFNVGFRIVREASADQ